MQDQPLDDQGLDQCPKRVRHAVQLAKFDQAVARARGEGLEQELVALRPLFANGAKQDPATTPANDLRAYAAAVMAIDVALAACALSQASLDLAGDDDHPADIRSALIEISSVYLRVRPDQRSELLDLARGMV